jgi:hypothetical protein
MTKTKEESKAKVFTEKEKQFTPLPIETDPERVRLVMQKAAYKALEETRKKS